MKKKQFKLTIELVPSSCWDSSLRKGMSRSRWDNLRKDVLEKSGSKCDICESTEKLHCHEIWHYNDRFHVQKLIGFQTLCNMCHFAKHIEFAEKLSQQGHLNFKAVVRHFLKVNKARASDFEAHRSQAFIAWEKRSRSKWKTDLGKFEQLVRGNHV